MCYSFVEILFPSIFLCMGMTIIAKDSEAHAHPVKYYMSLCSVSQPRRMAPAAHAHFILGMLHKAIAEVASSLGCNFCLTCSVSYQLFQRVNGPLFFA